MSGGGGFSRDAEALLGCCRKCGGRLRNVGGLMVWYWCNESAGGNTIDRFSGGRRMAIN